MKFKVYERNPDWQVFVAINSIPDQVRHCLTSTQQTFILEESAGQLTEDGFIGFMFLSEKLLFTSGGCSFSSNPVPKLKPVTLQKKTRKKDADADNLDLDTKSRDYEQVELEFPDSRVRLTRDARQQLERHLRHQTAQTQRQTHLQ